MRRLFITLLAVSALFLTFTSVSLAGIRGMDLWAPKSVYVNYTYCSGVNGCLTIVGHVSNNDGQPYSCQVQYDPIPGFFVFNSLIVPKQSLDWNLTVGYQGQTTVSFSLYCNGTYVPGQTEPVRVRT